MKQLSVVSSRTEPVNNRTFFSSCEVLIFSFFLVFLNIIVLPGSANIHIIFSANECFANETIYSDSIYVKNLVFNVNIMLGGVHNIEKIVPVNITFTRR